MSYLLDSHALLWFLENEDLLSPRVAQIVASERNRIFVSPVSVYELRYKAARGKLKPLPKELPDIITRVGFEELPINFAAAEIAAQISLEHRDPWDRLLAAQAIENGSSLISSDRQMSKHGLRTIW